MGIFRRREEIRKREDEPPDRRTIMVLAKLDIAVEKFYDRAQRLEEKMGSSDSSRQEGRG